ncbi:hypothetical protein ACLMJK_002842 [Lecanora helva]
MATTDQSATEEDNESNEGSEAINEEAIQEIKDSFYDSLESIGQGSYATAGQWPNINPGLHIKGFGKLGLPLAERDAMALYRMFDVARAGNSKKSRVRKAAQLSLEINPDLVECRNPEWHSISRNAMHKALGELSLPGNTSGFLMELKKVLLDKPGSVHDIQTCSPDALDSIATVTIFLPSEHSGGEVYLRLGDLEKTLRTEDAGEFQTIYLARYSDVCYAARPLASGSRLTLIYHLALPGFTIAQCRPSAVVSDPAKDLARAMAEWRTAMSEKPSTPTCLTYILDQKFFQEDHISLASLSKADQLRVQYLSKAAEAYDVSVYLAHFQHSRHGECDPPLEYDECDDEVIEIHDFSGDYTSTYDLPKLYTLEGARLGADFPIFESDFIEDLTFDDEKPDDEEYEGWVNPTITHHFRRSCILLLPRKERRTFFSQGSLVAADEWARIVLSESSSHINWGLAQREVLEICALANNAYRVHLGPRDANKNNANPQVFVDLALRFKQPAVLRCVASAGFEIDMFRELGQSSLDISKDEWVDAVRHALSKTCPGRKRLQGIDVFISSLKDAHHGQLSQAAIADLEKSFIQNLTETWSYHRDETREDANALLALHTKFGKSYISNTLLPLVRKSTNLTFVESVTLNALSEVKTRSLSSETATTFCENVYAALIDSIVKSCPYINDDWHKAEPLRAGDASEQLEWSRSFYEYEGMCLGRSRYLSPESLVQILELCEKYRLNGAASKMLHLLENLAETGNEVAFRKYLFPTLKALPPPNAQVEDERYQLLFRHVLTSYVAQALGKPPKKPDDWSRPKAGCDGKRHSCSSYKSSLGPEDCRDCRDLDTFLLDPRQPVMRFKASENRRKHLERVLPYGEYATHVDKSKGSPHILVIKKTWEGWRKAKASWETKRRQIVDEIRDLGTHKLATMLRSHCNDILVDIGYPVAEIDESSGTGRPPLGNVSSAAVNAQRSKRTSEGVNTDIMQRKRPRAEPEIIDLEADG